LILLESGQPSAQNGDGRIGLALATLPAGRHAGGLVRERVGSTGRRVRKVMVFALARKLLVALWRFVIDGAMLEGAVMKPSI
jgi:hypothetical protein